MSGDALVLFSHYILEGDVAKFATNLDFAGTMEILKDKDFIFYNQKKGAGYWFPRI